MSRRRALLAGLGLLASPLAAPLPALAEDSVRRAPRRRQQPADPQPLEAPQGPTLAPETSTTTAARPADAAPVPNREIEAPVTRRREQASLMPDLMQRSLPGRSQVQQGSESRYQDRLFSPGPGARLRLPFSF